jgi:hypothetical protein
MGWPDAYIEIQFSSDVHEIRVGWLNGLAEYAYAAAWVQAQ